ncbi:hypothetical protein FP026_08085 [Rhizobium tropici]|uniref:MftR C-terminal domain-containing protein n=2 Tax=Rhizobium tropici TaxID=398 RepID=A0A5B0WAQ7_RHITR|nr:hypothetical protein FP026_08085 [Rhizobium tropici]
MLTDAVRKASDESTPLVAARNAVLRVCNAIPSSEMIELDRLMRTSPSVQARKQVFYVQQEDEIYTALRERWPEPERSMALRTVAMLAVGAMRIAGDIFTQENGERPLAELLENIFRSVASEIR